MADQRGARIQIDKVIATPPVLPAKTSRVVLPRRKQASVLRSFFLFFFIVFVGGALIAPRLYTTVQFLDQSFPGLSWLASQPFHRFVNHCLILVALLALPSFFKALGIQSASALGLKWGFRHWIEGFQGFAWGFVTLAFAATFLVGVEVRVLDLNHDAAAWMGHLKNTALTALAVALIEELTFRGALFGGLRRSHPFWSAALVSAAFYALFHFLERPEYHHHIHWTSGLAVLAQMMRGFTDLDALIPTFLNLTLLGILLALVFERTGNILFSIGLHLGLVFWLQTFSFVTNSASESNSSFWGSDKLTDGWITGIILLLVFLLIERTLPPHRAPTP